MIELTSPFPLILAIISPMIWGFMNLLDKYVVSKKVRNALSFAVVAGIVNLAIGIVLSLFLGWNGIAPKDLMFPAIAGIIFGIQFYIYYYVITKDDISNVIGFIYVYPIIVAALSFLFIGEILSLHNYIGMFIILFGVVMLAIKGKKLRFKTGVLMIIFFIIVVALYEFLIKLTTNHLAALNGVAVSEIAIGLAILPGLFNKKIRLGFPRELKNIKWAMLNESLTFLGISTIYFAMTGLPATIVSSIAATQPLMVLFFEYGFNFLGIKISKDKDFRSKIIPITAIVIGVIILNIPQIA